MAKKIIKINSISGGISPAQYFPGPGQYMDALGIDPDLPVRTNASATQNRTSGLVAPSGYPKVSSTNITSAVVRLITEPKDNLLWSVQTNGRIVVSIPNEGNEQIYSLPGSEKLIGTVAGSSASWAEYYNNYIYVFGTGAGFDDVSRIGPLNTLPYDAQSGNFTVGLTITGSSSGATAVILEDVDAGTTGTLTLGSIKGIFTDNELITDSATGSATVNRSFASLITDNVWKGATLGSQTALTNTQYPDARGSHSGPVLDYSNHVAHVHGDNSLYFLDFKNGQGLVHRINTKKVTNEGDTNGTTVPSAYNVLDLPLGFYPTCLTTYGTSLVIVGVYGSNNYINQGNSAFVLWDPTDTVSFYLGPVPLPDPLATAVLNVNGILYFWTGNAQDGVRLSKYVGGMQVQDVVYQETGTPPYAGAVTANGNRILWGGISQTPNSNAAVVFAYGSKDSRLPSGVHSIAHIDITGAPIVSAVTHSVQSSNVIPKMTIATATSTKWQINYYYASATLTSKIRWMINEGIKFEVKKIIIPLMDAVDADTTITPKLYFDEMSTSKTLAAINNTNYPGARKVVYRALELKNTLAYNDIVFELAWTGTNPVVVGLPITIELDIKEDE